MPRKSPKNSLKMIFMLLDCLPGRDPARLQRLHLLDVNVADDPDGVDDLGPVRDLLPHLDGHVGRLQGPQEGDGASVGEGLPLGVLGAIV